MTLTFERDLDSVKMNQRVKHLGQESSSSKDTQIYPQYPTDSSNRTTKVVDNNN